MTQKPTAGRRQPRGIAAMTASGVTEAMRLSERPARQAPTPGTVDLASGDPDFPTPSHIREALREAVDQGYSNYPPANGDPELITAIAGKVSGPSSTDWDPADIAVTVGATGAVLAGMTAYLDPGDIVLIPQPTYSQYADVARLHGAEVMWVNLASDFHLDLDALRDAAIKAGERAKMLVLNNPGNPTGIVYRREELIGAVQIAQEFDLLILADEVYHELIFDGLPYTSLLSIPGALERLIYCQSLSKTYAMTGWRIGYVAAQGELMKPIAQVARMLSGGVTWTVQRAALAALNGPDDATHTMRDEYQARRDLISSLLSETPELSWQLPEAAFYAFIRYEAPITALEAQALLGRNGVRARSGTEYGPAGEQHIRLSFAASRESVIDGVLRVQAILGNDSDILKAYLEERSLTS